MPWNMLDGGSIISGSGLFLVFYWYDFEIVNKLINYE